MPRQETDRELDVGDSVLYRPRTRNGTGNDLDVLRIFRYLAATPRPVVEILSRKKLGSWRATADSPNRRQNFVRQKGHRQITSCFLLTTALFEKASKSNH
jgi:hypothetical protein